MLAYCLILLAVLVRFGIALHWLPAAFHFTPLGAALLYFGARRPRGEMWVPVAVLAMADVVLTKYVYAWPLNLETFSSSFYYVLALVLGSEWLREKVNFGRIVGGALAGSVLFFVISNLFVWADGGMYTLDLRGLVTCFVAAAPFFRATLIGDQAFALAFFGAPVLVEAIQRKRALAAAVSGR